MMLKDFTYYARWWSFWCILGTLLQPVVDSDFQGLPRWLGYTILVFLALLTGLACGLVFTVLQNKFNPSRKKPAAWIFAILVAFAGKLLWLLPTL